MIILRQNEYGVKDYEGLDEESKLRLKELRDNATKSAWNIRRMNRNTIEAAKIHGGNVEGAIKNYRR